MIEKNSLNKNPKTASHLRREKLEKSAQIRKLAAAFASPEGVYKVGAAMANPVRFMLDYMNIMRQFFVVQYVPAGVELYYDRDLLYTGSTHRYLDAVVVGPESSTLQYDLHRERVRLYTVEMISRARIHRREVFLARYDVILRAKDRIAEGQHRQEDLQLLGCLDAASTLFHNEVATTGRMDKLTAGRAIAALRRNRLPVNAYIFNPDVQLGFMTMTFQNLDQAGMEEVRKNGYLGSFYGVDIYHTDLIPREGTNPATALSHGYLVTTPEMLGWMPIYKDFSIEVDDHVKEGQLGWFGYMLYGLTCFNPRGVVRIEFLAEGTV